MEIERGLDGDDSSMAHGVHHFCLLSPANPSGSGPVRSSEGAVPPLECLSVIRRTAGTASTVLIGSDGGRMGTSSTWPSQSGLSLHVVSSSLSTNLCPPSLSLRSREPVLSRLTLQSRTWRGSNQGPNFTWDRPCFGVNHPSTHPLDKQGGAPNRKRGDIHCRVGSPMHAAQDGFFGKKKCPITGILHPACLASPRQWQSLVTHKGSTTAIRNAMAT